MSRAVIPFHPAATESRGVIPVRARQRDPESWAAIGFVPNVEPTEVPVGEALRDAAWAMPGNDRLHMPESVAIQRYLTDKGVDMYDLIDEFLQGQKIGGTTVERWLSNTGLRPLFSPVVEAGLRLGLDRVAQSWRNLVAREIPIGQMTYEWYQFEDGTGTNPAPGGREAFELKRVADGAPVPVARITVSGKSISLYQKGRGIEWTDASKAAPIDLVSLYFAQVGIDIGWTYHDEVIDALLNGSLADNSDDAPTLATGTPAVIKDTDLYTAQAIHQLYYGRTPSAMLMNIQRSVSIQTLENGAGQRVFPNGVTAAGLPPITISEGVPADKVIFVDTAFAIIRLVYKEFGTEFDRVPQSGVEGSYGRSIDRFVTFMPDARLILDS